MISTNIKAFTIRKAGADDAALILSFIRELAEYEKLSHEVVATEELLEETLFGERHTAEVLIGEYQGSPVAFALFFHNFSTFLGRPGIYLEDLFVKQVYRGKGLGRCMLAYLAHLARERGCGRLEWWVLDWNTPAIDFYRSLHATPMDEWTVFRITGESLVELSHEFRLRGS
ncbi:MAG: GNAT family N-acetyltransferase [Deltaproteobacteria bacterium]|nr:GNAT family N-acetyltransferase [Deltaproteobacteria bacterium]RLC19273.1 MAG: GNAT family N-acetyltransferase [Deltaproteobacteria bacterium]